MSVWHLAEPLVVEGNQRARLIKTELFGKLLDGLVFILDAYPYVFQHLYPDVFRKGLSGFHTDKVAQIGG